MNDPEAWVSRVLPCLRNQNVVGAEDAYVDAWTRECVTAERVTLDEDPSRFEVGVVGSGDLWFTLECIVRSDSAETMASLLNLIGLHDDPEFVSRGFVVEAPWIVEGAIVHVSLYPSDHLGDLGAVRSSVRRASILAVQVGSVNIVRLVIAMSFTDQSADVSRFILEASLAQQKAVLHILPRCEVYDSFMTSMIALALSAAGAAGSDMVVDLLNITKNCHDAASTAMSPTEYKRTLTPTIQIAANNRDASTIRSIVASGVDISRISSIPVLTAAMFNGGDVMKVFVDNGVPDPMGDLGFRIAVTYGNIEVARILHTDRKARRHREGMRYWVKRRRSRGMPTISDEGFEELFGQPL